MSIIEESLLESIPSADTNTDSDSDSDRLVSMPQVFWTGLYSVITTRFSRLSIPSVEPKITRVVQMYNIIPRDSKALRYVENNTLAFADVRPEALINDVVVSRSRRKID